jgi:predicted nucleotidyltransferase
MENKNIYTEEIGEDHTGFSMETPIREDAFAMDDELKIELIEKANAKDFYFPDSIY